MSFSHISERLTPSLLEWRRAIQCTGVSSSVDSIKFSSQNYIAVLTDSVCQIVDVNNFLACREAMGIPVCKICIDHYIPRLKQALTGGHALTLTRRLMNEASPSYQKQEQSIKTKIQNGMVIPEKVESVDDHVGKALIHSLILQQQKFGWASVKWDESSEYTFSPDEESDTLRSTAGISGSKSSNNSNAADNSGSTSSFIRRRSTFRQRLCLTTLCGRCLVFGISESAGTLDATLQIVIDTQSIPEFNISSEFCNVLPDHTHCCFTKDPFVFVTTHGKRVFKWNFSKESTLAKMKRGMGNAKSSTTSSKTSSSNTPIASTTPIPKSAAAKKRARDEDDNMSVANSTTSNMNAGSGFVYFDIAYNMTKTKGGKLAEAHHRLVDTAFRSNVTALCCYDDVVYVGLSNGKIVEWKDDGDSVGEQGLVYHPKRSDSTACKYRLPQRREGSVHLLVKNSPDILAAALHDSVVILSHNINGKNTWNGKPKSHDSGKWQVILEYCQTTIITNITIEYELGLCICVDAHSIATIWKLEKNQTAKSGKKGNSVQTKSIASKSSVPNTAISINNPPTLYRVGPEPSAYHAVGNQPTHYKPNHDLLLPSAGFSVSPGKLCLACVTVAGPELNMGYRRMQATGGAICETWIATLPSPFFVFPGTSPLGHCIWVFLQQHAEWMSDGDNDDGFPNQGFRNSEKKKPEDELDKLMKAFRKKEGGVLDASPFDDAKIAYAFQKKINAKRELQGPHSLNVGDVVFSHVRNGVHPLKTSENFFFAHVESSPSPGPDQFDHQDVVMASDGKGTSDSKNQPKILSISDALPDAEWDKIEAQFGKHVTPQIKDALFNTVRHQCESLGLIKKAPWDTTRKTAGMLREPENCKCPFCKGTMSISASGEHFVCEKSVGHLLPCCQLSGEPIMYENTSKCVACQRNVISSLVTDNIWRCPFCLGKLIRSRQWTDDDYAIIYG